MDAQSKAEAIACFAGNRGTNCGVAGPFWGWMDGATESSCRVSRQVTAALHATRLPARAGALK